MHPDRIAARLAARPAIAYDEHVERDGLFADRVRLF